MICSACEEFAAQSGTEPALCGNCVLLSPDRIKQVQKARQISAKLKNDANSPGKLIAELQQENVQLKADNAALQEQVDVLTKPPAKVEASKFSGQGGSSHSPGR